MDNISVLQTCPMSNYLQEQLASRFKLLRFWEIPSSSRVSFLNQNSETIRAVVGNGVHGVDAALIDSLPNLEIVASHSSGLDKIDLGKCRERGIRVTYAPGTQTDEVADLAILLAMATLRRLCEADGFGRSGKWRKGDFKLSSKILFTYSFLALLNYLNFAVAHTMFDPCSTFLQFSGKSVGIIGLGRIGSAIAKRAEAFGCPISYHSRSKKQDSVYQYYPDVVSLASNCQILIVACELTSETRHIVSREVIDALGKTGVLVNIARGPVVDEPELVSALVEGRLAGAGLDVLENEPDVPESLIGLDSVVFSPHAGTATVETRKALADVVIANLEAHFLNKPLLTPFL